MKNISFSAVLLGVLVFGLNTQAAHAGASASTSTAVQWPEYHAKPWTLDKRTGDMTTLLAYAPKNNDFIVGTGKYEVRIGTVSWYFDAADEEHATTMIVEGNILGNGPTVRRMFVSRVGAVDFQIKVNGEWKSVPPNSSVQFIVVNEDQVITKNTMTGVIVRVTDENGEVVMESRFENKNKKEVHPAK